MFVFLNIFLLDFDNKAILRTMFLLKLNVVEVGIKTITGLKLQGRNTKSLCVHSICNMHDLITK